MELWPELLACERKDMAMLGICWLTPVGWKAAMGLILR